MSYFDYGKTKYCGKCKVLVAAHCPICHSQLDEPTLLQWVRLIGPESARKTIARMKAERRLNGTNSNTKRKA